MPWKDRDVRRFNKRCAKYKKCRSMWTGKANRNLHKMGDVRAIISANKRAKGWLKSTGHYGRRIRRNPECGFCETNYDSLITHKGIGLCQECWLRYPRRNPSYRRNVMAGRKRIPDFDYERLFLQMHYSGQLNRSFVRLLACLDFKPALDLIYESEGKRQTRFSRQFPLIDFNELNLVIHDFSKHFTIKTIKTLCSLLKKRILSSGARIDIKGRQYAKYLNNYFEEYDFYPDACHEVLHTLNRDIDMLNMGLQAGVSLGPMLGISRNEIITEQGEHLMEFLETAVDYLAKLCGKCTNCEVYHGRESADFNRPIEVFQRDVIYDAFQAARYYQKGRVLKKALIAYVFDALSKSAIHSRLQRAPIEDAFHQRVRRSREIPFQN